MPHCSVEPLTEIERERARTMMRNNQKLESLGLTTLALIVNKSSAKSKWVAREDSGSLYEPDAMEDIEQGVVDKVSENSPPNNLTRSTVVPTGGTRGSKRVMPPVEQDQITRMTRQKTRELSSTQADDLNAANFPTQADEQIQMCDEGEPSAVNDRWIRGRSMGKHLDRLSRGLNTKIPVVIAEGKRRPEAPMQAAKLASESGIIVRPYVRYPQKKGSRCFIAHAHVAKQEKYKDVLPTVIDLFKDTHCSSKTGFSEPIRQAIAQMEAIIAEPAEEGQVQKTPVEAVAQVLPSSSSFLQNVGLEQAAPKRSGKSANVARVEELEAEVEAEKQGSAVLRDKIDSQQDELEALKKKVEESEEAREKQSEEIENLKKQAEENKKQSEETNALLRRLFSLNKE
ncbi:unnamed protein product [Urochloa decumbens]|uniref:Uncharacterized protein n=1 Tax=Urochloa decumbens TaxID=240449 RepID=A0ABC9CCZ5_9POAL